MKIQAWGSGRDPGRKQTWAPPYGGDSHSNKVDESADGNREEGRNHIRHIYMLKRSQKRGGEDTDRQAGRCDGITSWNGREGPWSNQRAG